jgi:hypothetical protein
MRKKNKLSTLLMECDPNISIGVLSPLNHVDGGPTTHRTCKEYSYDNKQNMCDETTYKYNDKGDQIATPVVDNICPK